MTLLTTIFAPFVALGILLGGLLSPTPTPQLGASELVPNVIAFFETTLAVGITSTSTDIYLTSATDGDGNSLASSTYAFVIDEGTGNEEIIMADCTGTTCANAIRGISTVDGRTEVQTLKQNHRRGASIKITDAPILMLVARALRGEAIVNFTPNEGGDLATKDYVDSVALGGGAVPASLTDDGILELATGLQAASSTATDQSGSPLTLHTGISTTTPTAGNFIPVTESDGKLNDNFIDGSVWLTVATKTPNVQTFDATTTAHAATSTWTKPSGDYSWVMVRMWGGGGGSGSSVNSGGGGGGAYNEHIYRYSELDTTVTVVVANGGADTLPGGNSTFASTTAYGGGQGESGDTGGGGGGGRVGAGGDNVGGAPLGGAGGNPGGVSTLGGAGGGATSGNCGGSSYWGGGGGAGYGTNNCQTINYSIYGGGGGAGESGVGTGGTSVFGGAGGASTANGSTPGGGAGGEGASGGHGRVIVITF